MFVGVHLITGVALGAAIGNRLGDQICVTLTASLALHILLDMVPHWDYTNKPHKYVLGSIDFLITLVLLVLGFRSLDLPDRYMYAGIASLLPDVEPAIIAIFYSGKKRIRFFPSHWNSFPHGTANRLGGLAVQVVLILASWPIMAAYAYA